MAVNSVQIIQGEDQTVTVDLKDKNKPGPDGKPGIFPLPGFTSCTAFFPAASGGGLPVAGVLISSDLGRVSFTLNEAFTSALNEGTEQSFEVVVDQGAQRVISQIVAKLEVVARLFP